MARGTTRAPSQHAFRGQLGATRTQVVQVTAPGGEIVAATVHVAVDAVADPELAERLKADEPERALNAIAFGDGGHVVIGVPVVYHDPAAEVLVLVLAEGDRHRELAERGRLYAELATERVAVPAYVRDFAVVFGARGLRAHLEARAEAALERARAAEIDRERAAFERERGQLERRRAELAAREAELERGRGEQERRAAELERRAAELDIAGSDVARRLADADRLRGEADRVHAEARAAAQRALAEVREAREAREARVEPRPDARAERPEPRHAAPRAPTPAPVAPPPDDPATNPFNLTDEVTSASEPPLPVGADPISTELRELPPSADPWIDAFAGGAAPSAVAVDDSGVRVALRVAGAAAALVKGGLDLRLQLHRTPAYPLISITVGAPATLRGAPPARALATALLDVAAEGDRRVLTALERSFAVIVDVVVDGRRARRVQLTAPLAGNVGYLVRAAQDHLRTLAQEHAEASPSRARKLVLAPDFDLLGAAHPEAGEWKADKLVQLDTLAHVRRALAVARRFARPSREDYLVCVRGYPLERWHAQRKAVLERAVGLGLWMGADLAQVAVSEGLARSRKDLVTRLDQAFDATAADAALNDLDDDAVADNRNAIAEEARTLGLQLGRLAAGGARPIASAEGPAVSGTISRPAAPVDFKARTVDELLALLDERGHRLGAALELCDRGEARAARPVVASVRRMGRAEAVRVLGASVRFGEAAAPALTAGLASSKSYLRHGCALALALLRTDAGTEAVIELLLAEPTEIWREVARAVGQVGPGALMPLASRLGRMGDKASAAQKERIAWAMAHIGVRGGRQAVETLAAGQSVVAPVARTALDLMAPAAKDELVVRPGATGGSSPGRDVTVNRAFSRRFFEALERGLPDLAAEGLEALDASGPMEMLDEDDLVEMPEPGDADDEEIDAAELDESDLIPT